MSKIFVTDEEPARRGVPNSGARALSFGTRAGAWDRALRGLLCGLLLVGGTWSARAAKPLLEFGWDEPDTSFLRTNLAQMLRTPFDGCVFHADYQKPDGAKGSFTWQGWGTNKFTETDLQEAFISS